MLFRSTRSILKNLYIETNTYNEDISSELTLNLVIGDAYIKKIQESLKQEEKDASILTLRRTTFHSQLSKIVESKIDPFYEFSSSLKKTEIRLNYEDIANFYKKDSLSIFQFFSIIWIIFRKQDLHLVKIIFVGSKGL